MGITRPTDLETSAIEKTDCYPRISQEKGACHALQGHKGKHWSPSGSRGLGKKTEEQTFVYGFHETEWMR